ncbi:MAG: choice-of-anchor X domain-containing protein [bacterium]
MVACTFDILVFPNSSGGSCTASGLMPCHAYHYVFRGAESGALIGDGGNFDTTGCQAAVEPAVIVEGVEVSSPNTIDILCIGPTTPSFSPVDQWGFEITGGIIDWGDETSSEFGWPTDPLSHYWATGTYTMTVTAHFANEASDAETPYAVTVGPSCPPPTPSGYTNPSITGAGWRCGQAPGEVIVYWDLAPGYGASGWYYPYGAYVRTAYETPAPAFVTSAHNSKRYTGLAAGTPIQFWIAPYMEGIGSYVYVTATPCGPPNAPSDLVGWPRAGYNLLSWKPANPQGPWPATGYKIWRDSLDSEPIRVGAVSGFQDAVNSVGQTNSYWIAAFNPYGESAIQGPVDVGLTYRVPYAPPFWATAGSSRGTISLSWNTPLDGGRPITEYVILHALAVGSGPFLYSEIHRVPASTTSWHATGLPDGDLQLYKLFAVSSAGDGDKADASAHPWAAVEAAGPTIRSPPACWPTGCANTMPGLTGVPAAVGLPLETVHLPNGEPLHTTFTIDWGDFNYHGNVKKKSTGTEYDTYWISYEFSFGTNPLPCSPFDGCLAGQEYDFILGRLYYSDAAFEWQPVPYGNIHGNSAMTGTGGHYSWSFTPGSMDASATEFGLSQRRDHTDFKIVWEPLPGDPAKNWRVNLSAAQFQLVAQPLLEVHGIDPIWNRDHNGDAREPIDGNHYFQKAGWGIDQPWDGPNKAPAVPPAAEPPSSAGASDNVHFDANLRSQAVLEYGQDPWAWSKVNVFRNFWYDGKQDIRASARELLHALGDETGILEQTAEWKDLKTPSNVAVKFDGPVAIAAHSMGGLVSRYALEVAAPGRGYVNRLITMETPHMGTGIAKDLRGLSLDLSSDPYYVNGQGEPIFAYRMDDWSWGHHWVQVRDWQESNPTEWKCPSTGGGAYRPWGNSQCSAPGGSFPGPDVRADFEIGEPDAGNFVLKQMNDHFVENHAKNPGMDYFFLAGEAWDDNGDYAVSRWSATFADSPDFCRATIYGPQPDGGNWYPGLTGDYSRGGPMGQGFHTFVTVSSFAGQRSLHFLEGRRDASVGTCPSSTMMSSVSMATAPTIAEPIKAAARLRHNSTTAGEEYTFSWRLSGANNATAFVAANPDVLASSAIALTAPNGTTSSFPTNSTWAKWSPLFESEAGGRLLIQVTPNPGNGTWKLKFTAPISSPAPFVSVTYRSRMTTTDETVKLVRIGTPAVFKVRMLHDGMPEGSPVVHFTDPTTNMSIERPLHDDGLGGDESAGDGAYSAGYLFAIPGVVPYQIHATSSHADRVFMDSLTMFVAEQQWMAYCPGQFVSPTSGTPGGAAAILQADPHDTAACVAEASPVPIKIPALPKNPARCQPTHLLTDSAFPANTTICVITDGVNICVLAGPASANLTVCGSAAFGGTIRSCATAHASDLFAGAQGCIHVSQFDPLLCAAIASQGNVIANLAASTCPVQAVVEKCANPEGARPPAIPPLPNPENCKPRVR